MQVAGKGLPGTAMLAPTGRLAQRQGGRPLGFPSGSEGQEMVLRAGKAFMHLKPPAEAGGSGCHRYAHPARAATAACAAASSGAAKKTSTTFRMPALASSTETPVARGSSAPAASSKYITLTMRR